jgi:hypothetical protein
MGAKAAFVELKVLRDESRESSRQLRADCAEFGLLTDQCLGTPGNEENAAATIHRNARNEMRAAVKATLDNLYDNVAACVIAEVTSKCCALNDHEDVDNPSLNCDDPNIPRRCHSQKKGNLGGSKGGGHVGVCTFPFTYNGNTYTSCADVALYGDVGWCSFDKSYRGGWGYCTDGCPGYAGEPINGLELAAPAEEIDAKLDEFMATNPAQNSRRRLLAELDLELLNGTEEGS